MKQYSRLKLIISLLLIILAAISGWLYLGRDAAQPISVTELLQPRPCGVHYAEGFSLKCYYSNNGIFSLPLALIQHDSAIPVAERDLLLFVPGGPGQGYMTVGDEVSAWAQWLRESGVKADILLFDPRGTGETAGEWYCPAYDSELKRLLGQTLPLEEEFSILNKALLGCLDRIAVSLDEKAVMDGEPESKSRTEDERASPLQVFSTVSQVSDIDAILSALSYQNVHLFGVSYGTRLALAAAHHNKVKSLVLDSPYPFSRGRYSDWPVLYGNSFHLHSKRYDEFTAKRFTSYDTLFTRVQKRLRGSPLELQLSDHRGADVAFALTPERLLELSFSVLYDESLHFVFYSGLEAYEKEGKENDDLRLVIEDFMLSVVDDTFNNMVYFAVECQDNEGEESAVALAALQDYPQIADYFTVSWEYDICRHYPFVQSQHVHTLPYADKPTLIFSGVYDPVTPVSWGEILNKALPRSRHVVVPQAGHGVLLSETCRWDFLNNFLQHGDTNISISCGGQ